MSNNRYREQNGKGNMEFRARGRGMVSVEHSW